MNLQTISRQAVKVLRDNSPTILTALGVSGTVTTAYLAAKASFKAANVLAHEPKTNTKKEDALAVWKLYIPTAISGACTIGAIIGGTRIGMKRTAAAYSLLAVSETAFKEYSDKVVEQIGVKKEQNVRDAVAQDKVKKNPEGQLIVIGSGQVLCFEAHTGRYFQSDMETLRKAQNTINAQMIRENYANLNDFYHLVGLPSTSYSSSTGWDSDKMLELRFSTVLTDDGRPCLSFEYNYVKPI